MCACIERARTFALAEQIKGWEDLNCRLGFKSSAPMLGKKKKKVNCRCINEARHLCQGWCSHRQEGLCVLCSQLGKHRLAATMIYVLGARGAAVPLK